MPGSAMHPNHETPYSDVLWLKGVWALSGRRRDFEDWGEARLRGSRVGRKLSEWRERERAASYARAPTPFILIFYIAILAATQAMLLTALALFIIGNLHRRTLVLAISMTAAPAIAFLWPIALGLILEATLHICAKSPRNSSHQDRRLDELKRQLHHPSHQLLSGHLRKPRCQMRAPIPQHAEACEIEEGRCQGIPHSSP